MHLKSQNTPSIMPSPPRLSHHLSYRRQILRAAIRNHQFINTE